MLYITFSELFPFQHRQTDVILDGQGTGEEDDATCNNLTKIGLHPQKATKPIGNTAQHACHGVDFLTENQGDFIDEYIAQHTAGGTRHTTHDDGHPEGITQRFGLLEAYHGEKRQTDGVEDEERIVQVDEILAESNYPKQRQART